MTKREAIRILVREGHRLRHTDISNRRMIAALKTLSVTGDDLLQVGYELELWKVSGEPYLTRNPRSLSFVEASAQA